MSAISATGLVLQVGDAVLIDGVDIAIEAGELVAVIGPNGAGKSSLMSVLVGDVAPNQGSVQLDGVAVTDMDGARLASERAFLGHDRTPGIAFSVAEVVAMGAWRRKPPIEMLEAAMEAMDVAHLRDRVVATLSSGEHNRVELARILVQDTSVIVLDEPLAALDVAHQERVLDELRKTARSGKAVLCVFHDLNAAAAYADRFVLLADGAVAAEGTGSEVLREGILSRVYGHPMIVTDVGSRTVVVPRDR